MDQPLRWGILGAANIAADFAEGVAQSTECVIAAIASRSLDRAQAWARDHAVPHAFGCYDDLLHAGAVDAIYNPLPNSLHAEWTLRALEAGLPVLCEKPFAVNAAEAQIVVNAANAASLPVAEAFMYRFHPMYDRIADLIHNGAIGTVTTVQASFTWYLDDRTQIPASAQLAGGALMDVGCYPVNLARWVASAEPLRACAFLHGQDVDDSLSGILEFPGGLLAHFDCGIESYERAYAEIIGTQGAIFIDAPWNPGDQQAQFRLRRNGAEETITTPGANRYRLEAEDFARAVKTGQPPRWTAQDAVANMAVIDALLASARHRGTPFDISLPSS